MGYDTPHCESTQVEAPWEAAAWTWSLDPVAWRAMQAELAVGHVDFCRDRPTIVSGATAGQDAPAIGPQWPPMAPKSMSALTGRRVLELSVG